MTTTKKTAKTKATKKTGEALRKEALAVAAANLAAIEAEQRAAASGAPTTNATDAPIPLKAALRANKAKPRSAAQAAKEPKAQRAPKTKKVSALDAAAQVLAGSKDPMNAKDMIAEMEKQRLWTSPGGKTPHATLYAAVIREIAAKGREARFIKTERGMFRHNPKAGK